MPKKIEIGSDEHHRLLHGRLLRPDGVEDDDGNPLPYYDYAPNAAGTQRMCNHCGAVQTLQVLKQAGNGRWLGPHRRGCTLVARERESSRRKKVAAKGVAGRKPCEMCGAKRAKRIEGKHWEAVLCTRCRSVPPSECEVCIRGGEGALYDHLHRRGASIILPKNITPEPPPRSRSEMEFIARMLARRRISYLSDLTVVPEVGTVVGAQITIPASRIRFTFDVRGRFQSVEKR